MDGLVQQSSATADFKAELQSFLAGEAAARVKLEGFVPRVKVRRLLTQLMAVESHLEIERVVIRGSSGCSDFVGSVDVETPTGSHVFEFTWCCRWRAENEGYVDYFGFPDQIRAAQEFDWRCFQRWERRNSN